MTQSAALPIDAAFAHALDLFDVPAMESGFVDRIAAMPAADAPALPPAPRRRLFEAGRRGSWARRSVIGLVALGIASATAAATDVFTRLHIDIPHIAAILSPEPKPALAKVHHAARAKPRLAVAEPIAANVDDASPGVVSPDALANRDAVVRRIIRRERAVAAIQYRLAERGVDVPKPVIRRQLIQNRVAIAQAIRGDMTTPLPPRMDRVRTRAAIFLDRHPEVRDQLRQRVEAADARRAARLMGSAVPEAGPDSAPVDTPGIDAAVGDNAGAVPDRARQMRAWLERRERRRLMRRLENRQLAKGFDADPR